MFLEHPSANAACAIFMMALQSTCGIVIGVADGARLEIIIIKAVGLTWIPRRRCCATLQDYAMMIILASSLIFPKFPESELSLLSLLPPAQAFVVQQSSFSAQQLSSSVFVDDGLGSPHSFHVHQMV